MFNCQRQSGIQIDITIALDIHLLEPRKPLIQPEFAQTLPAQRHHKRVADFEMPMHGNNGALTLDGSQGVIEKFPLFVLQHPANPD